jgi:hypothetical protein
MIRRAALPVMIATAIACGEGQPPVRDAGVDWTLAASDGAAVSDALSPALPTVRFVYLVPSDRQPRDDYRTGIERAAHHLQRYVWEQLDRQGTFLLADPAVVVLKTSHPAAHYATNDPGPGAQRAHWVWFNTTRDGFALTGGKFNDPQNVWIFYIDADNGCMQDGGGGNDGVAFMAKNDLRGLVGERYVPPCAGGPDYTFDRCRWVGGAGHELGHALGLPHPPVCATDPKDAACRSIMFQGYQDYPASDFLPEDRTHLRASPFVAPLTPGRAPFDCR